MKTMVAMATTLVTMVLLLEVVHVHATTYRAVNRVINRIGNKIRTIQDRLQGIEQTSAICESAVQNITLEMDTFELSNDLCLSSYGIFRDNLTTVRGKINDIIVPVSVMKLTENSRFDRFALDVPRSVQRCIDEFEGKPIDKTAAQVVCLQQFLWEFKPNDEGNKADVERIRQLVNLDRLRRPPTGHKVRKEYRMLTFTERTKFHNALNRLEQEGMMHVFGRIHTQAGNSAHNGPAFLPWHRAFLAVFEEALRTVDPSVSLPYWASSIDNDMDNPINSLLWTEEYLGNGAGRVREGPFANWVTNMGDLQRNFGEASKLIDREGVSRVLSQCYFANITNPTADRENNWEQMHGGVHVWVGGDMAYLRTAAYDPVFFMHHAYVDYIWELFMERQRTVCNVDPTTDYAHANNTQRRHMLDANMTGMDFFQVRDGLESWWTQGENPWFSYEDPPLCPYCGGADSLMCDRYNDACIPRSRLQPLLDNIFHPQNATTTTPGTSSSSATRILGSGAASYAADFSSTSSSTKFEAPEILQTEAPIDIDLDDLALVAPFIAAADVEAETMVPVNRGVAFIAPDTDGRTRTSALKDAIQRVEEEARR